MKKIGQCELSSEAKSSTRALPKTSPIFWTDSRWSVHSSEETLFLDNMSAPLFILPGTCVAFSEYRLVWAHTRRSFATLQRHFETKLPWWYISHKNWQAWHTASISRQLMCSSDSSSDQRPKVSLPSHSAPQPLLKESVVTNFLLCAVSKITPCFSQGRSFWVWCCVKKTVARGRGQSQSPITLPCPKPPEKGCHPSHRHSHRMRSCCSQPQRDADQVK